MLRFLFFLSVFFLIASCASEDDKTRSSNQQAEENNPSSSEQNDSDTSEEFTVETVATELDVPWAIQAHEDNFYITERNGTMAHIEEDGTVSREQVEVNKDIVTEGEGGLLGFQLDSNFGESQKAYLYHTYQENNSILNRIIAVTKQDDRWTETDVLLEGIPGASIHNGGRLKIGPDNLLYATTGDAGMEEKAQQPGSLAGSILRMNTDGTIPQDNPIEDSYVYSYGHRNPQGLGWNENNTLYSSEHGSSGHDEINQIQPGSNYGWPVITGDEEQTDMETPLFHSGNNTWAPSGSVMDDGSDFYVTGLRGTQLMRFDIETEEMEVVFSGEGRLRDVIIIDESMYVVTNNRDGRGNPQEKDDLLLRLNHYENHVE
ncbi:PQQ-dependent sugar dehydrogenase [Salibacterium salarium]|uniref:PQQ-dependent sugar dehydrogenase n=1 Tax=Salibacterium salarium TaxID=284579 RepID=UPI001FECC386|nr:PQQ-dependent sugar dehydrogenase [Salibacterium salarium]